MTNATALRRAVLVLLVLASLARAQLATGGGTSEPDSDAHAWAITPSTTSSDWGLWHIPPRSGAASASDGSVRIVDSLQRRPEAIAAFGGRVWMAFAGGGNRAGYTFLTAAVRPGAVEGTWYSGAGGRLSSTAYLETKGKLIALAAGSRGPIALVEDTEGSLAVAWLERGEWRWAQGPAMNSTEAKLALGVLRDGSVCVAGVLDQTLTMWRATLPASTSESGPFELVDPSVLLEPTTDREAVQAPLIEPQWKSTVVGLSASLADARPVSALVQAGARIVLAVRGDDRLHVLEFEGDIEDGRPSNAAREIYQTQPGGVALLADARRGVVIRMNDTAEGVQDRAATRLDIEEFSLDTGRLFFIGPAVFDGPISPSDLRILLVLMVLVSASLLLFVVRTSSEAKPYVPPRGLVLSPPIPRLLAGMADGFLALLLGGELSRLLPPGWLAIRVGADALDFAPLVLGLAIGLVGCTLLEAFTGRTLGKIIFGLAVSRSGEIDGHPVGPRRPTLAQALARNALKWLLPLVALVGLCSPLLRHRGDTMTGLGVVSEFPGAPEEVKTGRESDQDRTPDDR